MKNIPTTREREEMKRPTVKKFQRILDSLINYNEIHRNMLFYHEQKLRIRPKAIFFPEASPRDIYDYFIHGLIDTLHINDKSLKELKEFPLKVWNIIKGYKEVFARGQELFLNMHSSYLIFNKEHKLLVPSITVAQLGVSNKEYPSNDEEIEHTTPTMDDLAYSPAE
nr:enzymatic polyprotein [Tanacetum cinerariifolium]